jgi:hypothetical protein
MYDIWTANGRTGGLADSGGGAAAYKLLRGLSSPLRLTSNQSPLDLVA